jgi:hypothetical protein
MAGLKLLNGFCTSRLLGPVRIQDSVAEPIQDGRRDNQ